MKKNIKAVYILIAAFTIIGVFFLFRSIDEYLLEVLSKYSNFLIKSYWVARFQKIGLFSIILGSLFLLIVYIVQNDWLFVKSVFDRLQKFIEIIKNKLDKFIQFDTDKPIAKKIIDPKINLWDLGIILLFLFIALLIFYNPCQGNKQFIELGGDGSIYSSIAATFDRPELFKGDPMLDDINLHNIFSIIQVQLIRFIAHFTDNYGLSFMLLIIPHIFLQLLGFYLLGRILFNNRFWAFFLAIITFIPISLDQELWGFWLPLPRILFQTFLPYLWCLAFIWKNKPNKWPWLMILTGLIFYFHPFSGLTWGFCIWFGLWFFIPKKWSIAQKLIILLGLGLLFILTIAPYVYLFMSGQQSGISKDYEFVIYIMNTFFPRNINDAPAVLMGFIKITMMNGVLPIALLSTILLYFIKERERSNINLNLIWIIGILTISIVIPFFIGLVEKIYRIIPTEYVFTRGLRYMYPLFLLLFVWALAEIFQRMKRKIISSMVVLIGIVFLLCYGISQKEYFIYPWQKFEYLFLQGKPVCLTNNIKGQAIDSIKNLTPPGSKIFEYSWKGVESTEFYEIRYYALRPLVFHILDGGTFVVMNYDKLKIWYTTYWSILKINENYPKPCDRLSKIIELQKKLQADYLFVDSNGNDLNICNPDTKMIFNIENYYLYQ